MSILDQAEYGKTKRLFFLPSKRFEAQITDLFDDIWPTITALKHFRWQFRGYINCYGDSTVSRLHDKFVEEDDKHNRPNLKRAFIEQGWDDNEFRIAKNLLINLFAYYEAWCDDILKSLSLNTSGKNLQFSSGQNNYNRVVSSLIVDSDMNDFYQIYKNANGKRYIWQEINNYFSFYRLFKECRNSIAHFAGCADQNVLKAYANCSGIQLNQSQLSQQPSVNPPLIGSKIVFNLYSVVGFSRLLLNMVTTFDTEFIKSSQAKKYLIRQICDYSSSNHIMKISKIIPQLGFKSPSSWQTLVDTLNSNNCSVIR